MHEDRNRSDNALILGTSPNGDAGQSSHRENWTKIQQSSKDQAFLPTVALKDTGFKKPPEDVSSSSCVKKSNSGKGWILVLLMFGLILFAISLIAPHDPSYRDKMTPSEKYHDDLRNEQEAYENELHR